MKGRNKEKSLFFLQSTFHDRRRHHPVIVISSIITSSPSSSAAPAARQIGTERRKGAHRSPSQRSTAQHSAAKPVCLSLELAFCAGRAETSQPAAAGAAEWLLLHTGHEHCLSLTHSLTHCSTRCAPELGSRGRTQVASRRTPRS